MIHSALVVDDEPADLELARISLVSSKHFGSIHVARDGREALNFLLKFTENQPLRDPECPELVFLDLNMPVMDGFEFMEAYKKISHLGPLSSTRFIICTHSDNDDDKYRALSYTFVKAFFKKPFSPIKVKEIILNHFLHQGSRRPEFRQSETSYTKI